MLWQSVTRLQARQQGLILTAVAVEMLLRGIEALVYQL